MALTKSHILAVVLCLTMLCVPLAIMSNDDASAAYEAKPTISDTGYIENPTSLFYYAKFVCGGIPSASVSTDSPTKGIGLTMNSNSVYVKLSSLKSDVTYTVAISEYSSDEASDATASLVAKVTGSCNAFIYYSVGVGDKKVYNNGTQIASEDVTFTGAFTAATGKHIYKIELKDSDGKTIENKTVTDLAHFSHICRAEVIDYNESYEDSDLIVDLGKGYGFTSSKTSTKGEYAGKALTSEGYGKYVFAVFITNVNVPTLKITSGSNSYTVDVNHKFLNTTATNSAMNSGLGIVAVHEDILSENGVDIDSSKITVGAGDNVYASSDVDNHLEKKSNTLLYVGIGAIVAVVIIAALVAFKLKG